MGGRLKKEYAKVHSATGPEKKGRCAEEDKQEKKKRGAKKNEEKFALGGKGKSRDHLTLHSRTQRKAHHRESER